MELTIKDAKIVSSDKRARVRGGVYVTFLTANNMAKGDTVEMEFEGNKHYFEVSDISISGENLDVSAREVGYWARQFDNKKDFDLRKLIGVSVTPVTDKETLQKVNEMSCWC